MGLGWLRAAAQGYNYSCSKICLGFSFQNNLQSLVKFGWGLDGCARWRKDTVTVAVTFKFGNKFQNNSRSWLVKFRLGLGWLRAAAQGYKYSCNTIKLGSNC